MMKLLSYGFEDGRGPLPDSSSLFELRTWFPPSVKLREASFEDYPQSGRIKSYNTFSTKSNEEVEALWCKHSAYSSIKKGCQLMVLEERTEPCGVPLGQHPLFYELKDGDSARRLRSCLV